MTKEERRLLLIDLSARFPYNVAVDCRSENSRFTCYLTSDMLREIQNNTSWWEYKPYLFPLSSMTAEQRREYVHIANEYGNIASSQSTGMTVQDWFDKNHIDYRGLIPKGLAIDATGLNIY